MRTPKEVIQSMTEKGQTIVIVAISLIVILALAALAIDVGIAYVIKAKLNAAVDGAAIAAGRAVKQGSTDTQRTNNARNAAERFFIANYPAGFMGSTPSFDKNDTNNFNAIHNANGSWTIQVSARALTPTFFARAVGWSNMNVRATAESTVRDLDMVLVLDTSGSLNSPSGTFGTLKTAAVAFINRFQGGDGGDRVGLVTFASGAVVNVPINKTATRGFNKTTVINAINGLANPTSGATASAEGMRRAQMELDAIPADIRSSLRVIVFFSDGAPNMVSGTFCNNGLTTCSGSAVRRGDIYSETESGGAPYRMYSRTSRDTQLADASSIAYLPANDFDSTMSWADSYSETVPLASYRTPPPPIRTFSMSGADILNTRCNVNKAARNMVENVANNARSGTGTNAISVYTLGLGAALNNLEINFCGYGPAERGASILKRLANTTDSDTYNSAQPSGIYAYAATASELNRAFQEIANQILRISK